MFSHSPIAFLRSLIYVALHFLLWCRPMSHQQFKISHNHTRPSTAKGPSAWFSWLEPFSCFRAVWTWPRSSLLPAAWSHQIQSRTVSSLMTQFKACFDFQIVAQFCLQWTRNTVQRWASQRNSTLADSCRRPRRTTLQLIRFSTIMQFKWWAFQSSQSLRILANCAITFCSVRRQPSMSFLVTPKSASIDIRVRRSFSTLWPRSALIRMTRCCWVNVRLTKSFKLDSNLKRWWHFR